MEAADPLNVKNSAQSGIFWHYFLVSSMGIP